MGSCKVYVISYNNYFGRVVLPSVMSTSCIYNVCRNLSKPKAIPHGPMSRVCGKGQRLHCSSKTSPTGSTEEKLLA